MKNVLFSLMLVAVWLVAGCGDEFLVEEDYSDAAPDVYDQDGSPDGPKFDADAQIEVAAPDTSTDVMIEESAVDAAQDQLEVPDAGPDAVVDALEDAELDVAVDALLDADEDVEQDVAPDVPLDVAPEAQPEAGPDGPQPVDCELHGQPNQVTVIIRHAVDDPKVLAVAGKLTYDDVAQDSNFLTWCWGGPNQTELVCVPRDKNGQPAKPIIGVGMRVQFVPGQSLDGVQMTDNNMFCTATGCLPEGDYLVCNGKETLCRWDQGVPDGPTDLVIGPWGLQNLVCKIP